MWKVMLKEYAERDQLEVYTRKLTVDMTNKNDLYPIVPDLEDISQKSRLDARGY